MRGFAAIVLVLVLGVLAATVPRNGSHTPGRGSPGTTARSTRTTAGVTTTTRACTRTRDVVRIGISSTRYPAVLAHMDRAIGKGWPRVLTIERDGADARRDRLLERIPTRPGQDRDEWPMAFARRSYRADVAYVPSDQNRGSGAVIGIKLRRFCDGQRFAVIGY